MQPPTGQLASFLGRDPSIDAPKSPRPLIGREDSILRASSVGFHGQEGCIPGGVLGRGTVACARTWFGSCRPLRLSDGDVLS